MIRNWIGRFLGSNGSRTSDALLERIGLEEASHVGAIVDPYDRLSSELTRARRYEHAFSVAVLAASPITLGARNGNGNGQPGTQEHASPTIETEVPQVVSLLAAAALRELLRESDIVCYHASEDRFVLGLAESDRDAARYALRRVRGLLRSRLNLQARVGVARFPDDGLTLDDLVTEARRRFAGAPTDLSGPDRTEAGSAAPSERRPIEHPSPEPVPETAPGN